MLKKSISLIALSLFSINALTACGSRLDTDLSAPDMIAPAQEVSASSISGISKEIDKTLKAQFKDMDKNGDKIVTPEEYSVKTPEDQQAFRALDNNHDGKITLKEMLPGFITKTNQILTYRKAARELFEVIDKNHDHYVTMEELQSSAISSPAYLDSFKKYDTEKGFLFFKGNKNKLTKSEFENMFTSVALTTKPADAPAPADPSQPAQ